MKDLIANLKEHYQDILYQGELYEGKRKCQDRWDIIKPHIRPHDVVLDIGSSTGYFAIQIARMFPDSLVVSFESSEEDCQVQKKILKDEGIYNVVLCQHRLCPEDLLKWSRHVEIFDVTLLLSVLHHLPEGKVEMGLEAIRDLSKVIICELPNDEEREACGQKALREASRLLGAIDGQWLGSTGSHLGYERNVEMFLGNNEKKNLDAYFGVDHIDRHKFNVESGKINDKFIIKGVNVWNLLHFNIIWPEPYWWITQAKSAYECLDFKSDVRPWNLLRTANNLVAVDTQTKFPQGDQAEYKEDDIRKLIKLFSQMKPIDWRQL